MGRGRRSDLARSDEQRRLQSGRQLSKATNNNSEDGSTSVDRESEGRPLDLGKDGGGLLDLGSLWTGDEGQ